MLVVCVIVEGDWFGNPANFKGVGYCFSFEVEKTSHVTSTVYNNQTNMADDTNLFLFGDNFDAILEIMETEDNIDVHFEDAVAEVSGVTRVIS